MFNKDENNKQYVIQVATPMLHDKRNHNYGNVRISDIIEILNSNINSTNLKSNQSTGE